MRGIDGSAPRRCSALLASAAYLALSAGAVGLAGTADGSTATGAMTAATATLASWPMFQYGASHSGDQPRETVLSPSTVSGLLLRWSATAETDPAVIAEKVGSSTTSEVVVTSTSTGIAAYAGTSGGPTWSSPFPTGSTMSASSAVAAAAVPSSSAPSSTSELVFAPVGGSTTAIEALSAITGAKVWADPWPSTARATCAPPHASIESPLTVTGGTLYGQTSGGCVFALDASTGAVSWVTNGTPGLNVSGQTSPAFVPAGPAVSTPELAVGTYPGKLVVLSAATGAVLFAVAGCGDGESSPAVAAGVIYANGSRGLCAVNASTGAVLFTNPCGVSSPASPALVSGDVYVSGTSGAYSDEVCSVGGGGSLNWAYSAATTPGTTAVANGVVYVALHTSSTAGYLVALDETTGAVLYEHAATLGTWSSPVVANGWVYLGDDAYALAPPPACASGWVVQQKASFSGQLEGLAASSRTSAWAVGARTVSAGVTHVLIERYAGTSWVAVSAPSPSPRFDLLSGVASVGGSGAWAVGGRGVISGSTKSTLIEHWNGSHWTVVRSPNPSRAGNELSAVAAESRTNAWAVGGDDVTSAAGPAHSLVLRWNGSSWSVVPSPSPGTSNSLSGLSAIPGTKDLWAVGSTTTGSRTTGLIERWNGSKWTVVAGPSIGGGRLFGVAALGPGDAWAVGGVGTSPLILHWNGAHWSRAKVPVVAGTLRAVAAVSASRIFAVGEHLVLHWPGGSWMVQAWPRPSYGDLAAVAVARSKTPAGWTAWAGGGWSSTGRPLVIDRCSAVG